MKVESRKYILLSLFLFSFVFAYAQAGVDSVSSAFFRDWYLTTDLGHYLDNSNAYTIYEAETTGEWNLGDQQVFSIAGNSFKNNKYHLNGMRIDSRSRVGSTLLHTQMDRTSMVLDYHDGELFFTDDSLQRASLRLTGNVGGLGGIAPGTREMINLFHKSASERMIDNRPVENRNRIVGAGTAEAAFPIRAYGRDYYQHAYVYYGQRCLTAFDHTGISGMYDAASYTAQLDGEIPLNSQLSTINSQLLSLRYFLVTTGRTDYGSEFLYNANEQATSRAYQAGLYATSRFDNGGTLVAGISYELSGWRHDSLSFTRNIMDQDGEGFEPWYPDGRLHSVNLSVRYDQPLLSWLSVHAEGYNSVLHFHPTTRTWSNALYRQSFDETTPTPLYTYQWQASPFTAGLLENEAMVIARKEVARGLLLYAHAGVSLDGILLGHGRTIVSPNALVKIAIDYRPCSWFRFGLSLSHHRMSYTWDDVRYLSADYMNGEARYTDNALYQLSGGAYHQPKKDLSLHQPSYAVLDLPIYFTFGKDRRHEIAILSTIRKYYHQWYTTYADDGVSYTIGTMPLDLMSSRPGARTPHLLSNLVRYTYTGRKWFVQLSWQSYFMSGISALGNGPLSNNIGILSESTARPETGTVIYEGDLPYQANGRLNQDRAYIARIQVTYNACRYFSISLNGKFKDGQPFTNYEVRTRTVGSHEEATILPYDARGINLANNAFGKREDAFFNFDLRATGRWWVKEYPMSLEVQCYNIYDFGTALTEYTFDRNTAIPPRTTMSMCIPRGLLVTLRVGLEKDKDYTK